MELLPARSAETISEATKYHDSRPVRMESCNFRCGALECYAFVDGCRNDACEENLGAIMTLWSRTSWPSPHFPQFREERTDIILVVCNQLLV